MWNCMACTSFRLELVVFLDLLRLFLGPGSVLVSAGGPVSVSSSSGDSVSRSSGSGNSCSSSLDSDSDSDDSHLSSYLDSLIFTSKILGTLPL